METNNYDLIKISKFNRETHKAQVEKLKKSINELGYLKYNPIVVDKNYNIIDGQHRYLACKELGLPIYFIVEEKNMEKVMIGLNSNQKSWSLKDYVDFYENKSIKFYVFLKNFMKKYNFNLTTALAILVYNTPTAGAKIKQGYDFEIVTYADDIAKILKNISPVLHFAYHRQFVRAIVRLYLKGSKKDLNRLLDNILLINQQANTREYLLIFENIINKHKRHGSYITLR